MGRRYCDMGRKSDALIEHVQQRTICCLEMDTIYGVLTALGRDTRGDILIVHGQNIRSSDW